MLKKRNSYGLCIIVYELFLFDDVQFYYFKKKKKVQFYKTVYPYYALLDISISILFCYYFYLATLIGILVRRKFLNHRLVFLILI